MRLDPRDNPGEMIKPPEESHTSVNEGAIADEVDTKPNPVFRPAPGSSTAGSSAFVPLES